MQGHRYQQNARLSYSQWSQHRAESGLIYLSHPVTGEVKWLWSRHHDPKTSKHYLVNTVTGDRTWVTKQNEHLCPITPQSGEPSVKRSSQAQGASKGAVPASSAPKVPANTPVPTTRPANKPTPTKYREIAAPKSLGLTADEVLMLVPETGRRYIYNKKTKSSCWLPDRPPDTSSSESKIRFGRKRNSKPSSSPFDDEDVAPEMKERSRFAVGTPSPSRSVASSRASDSSSQRNAGYQRQTPSHAQGESPSSHYSNGYSATPTPLSAEEAAMYIQRAFRANLVGKGNVLEKLRLLTNVVDEVKQLTAAGKYDMTYLRGLAERRSSSGERQDGAQRLLELGEYLTQQMLKVDAVESSGNQLVRAKRKQCVKMILGLTDEADALGKKLR